MNWCEKVVSASRETTAKSKEQGSTNAISSFSPIALRSRQMRGGDRRWELFSSGSAVAWPSCHFGLLLHPVPLRSCQGKQEFRKASDHG